MHSTFTFHNPRILWLLLILPAWIAWELFEPRSRAALRFSATHIFALSARGLRPKLLPVLPLLRALALASAIIALARPQTTDSRIRRLSGHGIDIVIALDLSTSMEAGGFRPHNRIFVAKQGLTRVLDTRVNERDGWAGLCRH